MAGKTPSTSRAYTRSWFTVLRRGCVVDCPPDPDCSGCKADERCKLVTQTCTECAHTVCVGSDGPPGSDGESGAGGTPKTNCGAIAGGIVGGVVVIAVIWCLWWFCIRRRKDQVPNEIEKSTPPAVVEPPDGLAPPQLYRRSLAPSVASTVLTRTSNCIPIAYIPGASGPLGQNPNYDDRYFHPHELRNSVFSETSSDGASITPSLARSSIATTLFRSDAVISPVPAQQVIAGKAAVVSLRPAPSSDITAQKAPSSNSGSASSLTAGEPSTSSTPRSPLSRSMSSSDDDDDTGDSTKAAAQGRMPQMSGSIVARTMTPRTINIYAFKSGVTKQPMTIPEADESNAEAAVDGNVPITKQGPQTIINEAESASQIDSRNVDRSKSGVEEGPFADPPGRGASENRNAKCTKTTGPFGDEHELVSYTIAKRARSLDDMPEDSDSATQLPGSRDLITLILRQLSHIAEGDEAARAAKNYKQDAFDEEGSNSEIDALKMLSVTALAEVKNLLLTLHSVFPSELLCALDILDRRQIKEVTIISGDDSKEYPASQRGAAQRRPIYIVKSPKPANRRVTSRDEHHVVCLDSWNCSCSTFTAAATGDAFLEGFDNGDETRYSNAEHDDTRVDWPTDQFRQYEFGGLLPKSFTLAQIPSPDVAGLTGIKGSKVKCILSHMP
ncbi:hypothetical protein KEM54_001313 [Ascosphaera aggregata]|nr:hypothetical protein KEM54_001313 [Ascosphaera aggregata]